ncbi:MAG: 1-acyl-sn-glycerol-3-phosphate acyltransferase [Spirochaetes bacterium]|nr:1-acyl-sn-glycerol-3-phosphate acyltransferase [Spirochaetota bacterium]
MILLGLLAATLSIAWTFLICILSAIIMPFFPYSRAATRLLQIWCRGLLTLVGARLEVRGLERIGPGGHFLLISNHQSLFDIPALIAAYPGPFRMVAKKELFRIPIFGWCMTAARFIPIDRKNRHRAAESLRKAAERIRSGVSVLLFPEGTRSPDGSLLPYKRGPFALALESGVPILPVVVSGTIQILHRRSFLHFGFGKKVVVVFGAPIPVAGRTADDRGRLMGEVESSTHSLFEEVRAFSMLEESP